MMSTRVDKPRGGFGLRQAEGAAQIPEEARDLGLPAGKLGDAVFVARTRASAAATCALRTRGRMTVSPARSPYA